MLFMYVTEVMVLLSIRYWWIWNCNTTDNMFIVNLKVKFSTVVHFLCIVMMATTISVIKLAYKLKDESIFDLGYELPMFFIVLMMNTINFIRVSRLYFTWYKEYQKKGKF